MGANCSVSSGDGGKHAVRSWTLSCQSADQHVLQRQLQPVPLHWSRGWDDKKNNISVSVETSEMRLSRQETCFVLCWQRTVAQKRRPWTITLLRRTWASGLARRKSPKSRARPPRACSPSSSLSIMAWWPFRLMLRWTHGRFTITECPHVRFYGPGNLLFFFRLSPRRRIKLYWKTNMASSGWRWKTRCCSVWRSTKDIRTNTTSAFTPVICTCIIKVNKHIHHNRVSCTWYFSHISTLLFLHHRFVILVPLLICSGLVNGGTSVSDVKLPCRTHPHWLEPTIYQSETSPERASTPSEGIGLEARSMLSVAVKISSQSAERNVKVGRFVCCGDVTVSSTFSKHFPYLRQLVFEYIILAFS